MGYSCVICSESLERTMTSEQNPGQPPVQIPVGIGNVMSTLCGHVYHSYCIIRWMNGTETVNKSCPMCRKSITYKKCVALYHNSYDASININPADFNEEANYRVNELQEKVSALEKDIEARDNLVREKEQLLALTSEQCEQLNQSLRNERIKSENYMLKFREAESYRSYAESKEKEVAQLQASLKHYKDIKDMLDGLKPEIRHDVNNYPITKQSVKDLFEIRHMLEQQLSKERRDRKKADLAHKAELSKNEKAFNQLKLQQSKESRNRTPTPVISKKLTAPGPGSKTYTLVAETPKTSTRKTRIRERGSRDVKTDIKENTIILSSTDDEDEGPPEAKKALNTKLLQRVRSQVLPKSAPLPQETLSKSVDDETLSPMVFRTKTTIPGLENDMIKGGVRKLRSGYKPKSTVKATRSKY